MKKVVLLIVLVLLLASCAPSESGKNFAGYYPENCTTVGDGKTCRIVDREAGVVCWVYFQNGISCLPIKDTLLSSGGG